MVGGMIAVVEGRLSRRALMIGLIWSLVLILVYDLPFEDLLLPPMGMCDERAGLHMAGHFGRLSGARGIFDIWLGHFHHGGHGYFWFLFGHFGGCNPWVGGACCDGDFAAHFDFDIRLQHRCASTRSGIFDRGDEGGNRWRRPCLPSCSTHLGRRMRL